MFDCWYQESIEQIHSATVFVYLIQTCIKYSLFFFFYNSSHSETRYVTVMFKHTIGILPENYSNNNSIKEDDKPLRYNEEIVTRANTKL